MAVKELDWRGRTMLIRRGWGHGHEYIECDGFNATPRELEVLRLKAMGMTHRGIGIELKMNYNVSRQHIFNLKNRNGRMVEGREVRPSTLELIKRAEELELLNPYAIKGLKSILEKIEPDKFPNLL